MILPDDVTQIPPSERFAISSVFDSPAMDRTYLTCCKVISSPFSDILSKAFIHEYALSTSAGFVSAVDPGISVISLGADNSYGFPNERVLENLSGTDVYRTDINGDITVIADKEKIKKVKKRKSRKSDPVEGQLPLFDATLYIDSNEHKRTRK